MRKSLIVFLSLLFYTAFVMLLWHTQIRSRFTIPFSFSILFFSQFFILMFLLLERFFIVEKQRGKWQTVIFGSLTATILGGIIWIEASFLDEHVRIGIINRWNWENMTVFSFLLGGVESAMIGAWSTLIGLFSALTSRKFINQQAQNVQKENIADFK